jgi:hypothetical protein
LERLNSTNAHGTMRAALQRITAKNYGEWLHAQPTPLAVRAPVCDRMVPLQPGATDTI